MSRAPWDFTFPYKKEVVRMKNTFRLIGALALAVVLAPTVFGGDPRPSLVPIPPPSPRDEPPSSAWGSSLGNGLPIRTATPSRPQVVRPVYVVSIGARNGSAESAIRASKNIQLAQDLVAILNETKSPDVLLMTMETLAELKAEPHLVIPAIIRNAERLNLLEGICTSETRNRDQKKILEMLEFFTRRSRLVAKAKKPLVPTTCTTPSATVPLGSYVLPPKSATPTTTPSATPTPVPAPPVPMPVPSSPQIRTRSSSILDSF
jgi:hypothetical protein